MRVLVTGGRDYRGRDRVWAELDALHREYGITELIEGGATGADDLARQWAEFTGVRCTTVEADWRRWGNRAGPIRNSEMATMGPDVCVVFPGGRGTSDMMRKAYAAGISVKRCDEGKTR